MRSTTPKTTVKLIVISGGLASGKTALADRLKLSFGCYVVRTSSLVWKHLPSGSRGTRRSLQIAGNKLDRQTRHGWIAAEVAQVLRDTPRDVPIVLEGVRKPKQMDEIQKALGHRYVRHVHLSVDPKTQKQRFEASNRSKDRCMSYEVAVDDASERQVAKLAPKADIVIDTARHSERDVFSRVSARLNLQSRSSDRLVDVVVGGQYGLF